MCAMHRRSRWCIWSRGSFTAASSCSTPNMSLSNLKSFGAVEISRRRYTALLDKALAGEPGDFLKLSAGEAIPGARALEIIASRQ
ncbi:hypothetical protein ABIA09_001049 [Bradyrhizobium yuanmingense]